MSPRHFTLAITGASGAIYGVRLAQELFRSGAYVNILISKAGFAVLKEECALEWKGAAGQVNQRLREYFQVESDRLTYYEEDDLLAPIASGSSAPHAMIVAPCSMGSLSRISSGNSGNLIERCADVMLKEQRKLVVVPRETPLHAVHLEKMLTLSRMGAVILPAMAGFYHNPRSVDEIIDFIVGKVLDMLNVEHALFRRWGKDEEGSR